MFDRNTSFLITVVGRAMFFVSQMTQQRNVFGLLILAIGDVCEPKHNGKYVFCLINHPYRHWVPIRLCRGYLGLSLRGLNCQASCWPLSSIFFPHVVSFTWCFPTKYSWVFLIFHACYMSMASHTVWVYYLGYSWWGVQILKLQILSSATDRNWNV